MNNGNLCSAVKENIQHIVYQLHDRLFFWNVTSFKLFCVKFKLHQTEFATLIGHIVEMRSLSYSNFPLFKSSTDQKIVGNSFRPKRFIKTQNHH